MIYTQIAYCPREKGKNLGWAYNNCMNQINSDDWMCFLDHDAMFTTWNWNDQLNDIIKKYPDIGLFTCKTNRIGNKFQLVKNIETNNHDIFYHRNLGKQLQKNFYYKVSINDDFLLSGVLMLISKKTWIETNGFIEKNGLLKVDHNIHQKCKNKNINVGLMHGVYVYHWYRGDGNKDHLK